MSDPLPQQERLKYLVRRETGDRSSDDSLRQGFHSRGYLPHLKIESVGYFVTFRLADSLPIEIVRSLRGQYENALAAAAKLPDAAEREKVESEADRKRRREIEHWLDRGCGECHLRNPDIAELVASALRFFDGQRYSLGSWVVMPNHVHVVVQPISPHVLSDILRSWKTFTSRQANLRLGRTGESFWQRESFDRWIRDMSERQRVEDYIDNNPVKAGLCPRPEEWRWGSRGSELE